jgi:hypothetical protein
MAHASRRHFRPGIGLHPSRRDPGVPSQQEVPVVFVLSDRLA